MFVYFPFIGWSYVLCQRARSECLFELAPTRVEWNEPPRSTTTNTFLMQVVRAMPRKIWFIPSEPITLENIAYFVKSIFLLLYVYIWSQRARAGSVVDRAAFAWSDRNLYYIPSMFARTARSRRGSASVRRVSAAITQIRRHMPAIYTIIRQNCMTVGSLSTILCVRCGDLIISARALCDIQADAVFACVLCVCVL